MNKESHPESDGYIGIKDIAKLAGISTATVSCVINNPEMASEEVRKKMQKVIGEYNYIPDQSIRKIFSKTSSATTVFIYDMENSFFTSLIKELNQIRLEHNYILLICDTGSNPELEKKYLYFCLASRCAGIILTGGVDSDIFEVCRIHIPVTFLGRKTHGKFSSVHSNNKQMIQPIVDCLYNLGHRKIAFVGYRTPIDSIISRQNDYVEAMARKGFPIIQEHVHDRNLQLTLQAGSQAPNYFLPLPAAPTAIVYCNDIIVLGALNAAYSLGLKIPVDMPIVGFDNIISNLHQPQIITMRRNLRDVSLELFELVVNPPEEPVSRIVEASFIEGVTYSRIETPQK